MRLCESQQIIDAIGIQIDAWRRQKTAETVALGFAVQRQVGVRQEKLRRLLVNREIHIHMTPRIGRESKSTGGHVATWLADRQVDTAIAVKVPCRRRQHSIDDRAVGQFTPAKRLMVRSARNWLLSRTPLKAGRLEPPRTIERPR